jgi:hypothetical protein
MEMRSCSTSNLNNELNDDLDIRYPGECGLFGNPHARYDRDERSSVDYDLDDTLV